VPLTQPAWAPDILAAYRQEETIARLWRTKVGCFLVVALMPAGTVLDWAIYPQMQGVFLWFRLGCTFIAAVIWGLLFTDLGRQNVRLLAPMVPLLPAVFIAMMIAVMDGFNSPYYAGLNLVLIAVGTVLVWTARESVVFVLIVLGFYLVAGIASPAPVHWGTLVSNLVFIAMMDFIVVVGSFYQTRLRLQEFSQRFELDRNRQILEETNRKLREMDEMKSRFFANISHELRTPLTLLVTPLEALVHRGRDYSETEAQEMLATMHSHAMRLLKLINDLLDLVRLDSGRLRIKREPVSVPELVQGLASEVRPAARDKGVKIAVEVSPDLGEAPMDRDKLEKVLLNLIFNAIKFTAAGGTVTLRARAERETLVLEVADTGKGIAPEQLPFIFDRFWQGDSSSRRKYQGTGLGLAIVKEFVEAHGGTVTAQSELGRGTLMTVRLPLTGQIAPAEEKPDLARALPEAAAASGPEAEWLTKLYRRAEMFPAITSLRASLRPEELHWRGRQPKLLLADDEPDMLRFLKSQLNRHFEILEAVDGRQAVDKAAQFLPDVMVCDMMMPELDGLQVCLELRQRTPTRNLPILLLTARADEETKLAALRAGASDFLAKPFSVTELHVRLKNLVEAHTFARRLAEQNQALESALEQLKETETQLVHTEKLVSLGRLSAGIIHEINNPLNYARSGVQMLRRLGSDLAPERQGQFKDILQDIEEGINRVSTIVSDLRTFTHPNPMVLGPVCLDKVVETGCRFLSHEIKHGVNLIREVQPNLCLEGNASQLTQVLVNLLQNSLDALRQKSFAAPERPTIWVQGGAENGRIFLAVRDNGDGIAPENLGKVFDPFFTTKDAGQGMGLGLSICYRIVQEHGGQIRVLSERGKFCEFRLDFPSAALD